MFTIQKNTSAVTVWLIRSRRSWSVSAHEKTVFSLRFLPDPFR